MTRKPDGFLLLVLPIVELAIGAALLCWQRLGEYAFVESLATVPGLVVVMASAAALSLSLLAALRWRRADGGARRRMALATLVNVTMVTTMLVLGEVAVRALAARTAWGEVVLGQSLVPRSWDQVATRGRSLVAGLDKSYFVYDEATGWTVGRDRASADGMYLSSAEGLRCAKRGEVLRGRSPQHRVVLVGDSFTFGADIRYEETWGAQLEQTLGAGFEVLNFGVPGFAIDQIVLRFEREVLDYRPEVVVFGFFPHDVTRTMTVYTFIAYSRWEYPFSKPRFVIRGGDLVRLNDPVLRPEEIFARAGIDELPHLRFDSGFRAADWRWRSYHASYLARLLTAAYPPWDRERPEVAVDQRLEINARLLARFVRSAVAAGAKPIVVFMPDGFELGGGAPRSLDVLAAAGVEFLDLTATLTGVPAGERFAVDHYSATACRAIADFMCEPVRSATEPR